MVQIIPRAQNNKYEDLFQGITGALGGAEAIKGAMNDRGDRAELKKRFGDEFGNVRNPQLQQMLLQGSMQREVKEADKNKRLAALDQIKKTDFWQKATDIQKAAVEAEIRGDFTGKTASSLINAEREQLGNAAFNQAIEDDNENDSTLEPGSSENDENFNEPSKIKPRRNYDAEIGKWQKILSTNPDPAKRESAKSKISELQNLRDLDMRAEKFQFQKDQAYKTEVDKSYDAQKSFIDDTTKAYRSYETEFKPRLLQMQKMASDSELISPTAAVFLEALGIPLGALDDPSSELFQKVSQDMLKGLPESYGSRILKVEVENFLKTIPQLQNSPEGRRMIASNMLKLGEMKEVFYKEMRKKQMEAVDNNEKLPKDFEQRIFDQTLPQINKIQQEFSKLSEIKSVPKNTIPFFNPSGNVEFVPKDLQQWALDNGGKRIW